MKRFEDKVALITGAASGIGQATAVRLAQEGAKLALLDVNEDGLKQTAGMVDGEAAVFACDVTSEDSVKAAVAGTVEKLGKLNVVCNIAGVLKTEHTHKLSLEEWNRIIAINLTGPFLVIREALPHLLESQGAIVNMSSTAALGSHPYMAAYASSKAGLIGLTREVAYEYIKKGVRANAICAGGVMTPLSGSFILPEGGKPKALERAMPLMPYAMPKDIAGVVAFLASDDASYITGVEVRADGGSMA